jgi:hypothetical protein
MEITGTHEKISGWLIGTQLSVFDWLAVDAGLKGDFQSSGELAITGGLWFGF